MRRRAGDKTTTRSTSIELSRGGAVAVVVVGFGSAEILPPLARIALGAAVQTGLLYALAGRLDALATFTRASALLAIVFGSSYFGSVVDAMGSSAATRQVLDPNRIPVSSVRGGYFLPSRCRARYRVRIMLQHLVLRPQFSSIHSLRQGDADWYAGLKKPRWNPP